MLQVSVLQVASTRYAKYCRHEFNFKQHFVTTKNTGSDTRKNTFNFQCNIVAQHVARKHYLCYLALKIDVWKKSRIACQNSSFAKLWQHLLTYNVIFPASNNTFLSYIMIGSKKH